MTSSFLILPTRHFSQIHFISSHFFFSFQMPEITASHRNGAQLSQCFIQLMGMLAGLGIMLVIALYEHDLKEMFTNS